MTYLLGFSRLPNTAFRKVTILNRLPSPHQGHLPHIPDPIYIEMKEIDSTGQGVGPEDTRMAPGTIIAIREHLHPLPGDVVDL
jgi:hypothetical protein